MKAIYLNQSTIQSLISRNKEKITALEGLLKEGKQVISELWDASNPMDKSMQSETAFTCLNEAKDMTRKIRKEINLLASFQKSLKKAVR